MTSGGVAGLFLAAGGVLLFYRNKPKRATRSGPRPDPTCSADGTQEPVTGGCGSILSRAGRWFGLSKARPPEPVAVLERPSAQTQEEIDWEVGVRLGMWENRTRRSSSSVRENPLPRRQSSLQHPDSMQVNRTFPLHWHHPLS